MIALQTFRFAFCSSRALPLYYSKIAPAAREDRPCSRHGAASPIRNGTPSKSKRSGDSGRPAAQPAGVGAEKDSKQPYGPQRLGEALLEAFLEKEGEGLELAVKFVCSRLCVTGPVCLLQEGGHPVRCAVNRVDVVQHESTQRWSKQQTLGACLAAR
jgi:hypothetical protein